MPATHLMSVDLPAPLSPTSAITSPLRTSKSTSASACTEPKLFEIPRSSSAGASFALAAFMEGDDGTAGAGALRRAPAPQPFLLAVLRVGAVADVLLLQVAVEELLVVRLRDRDGLED